MTTSSSAVRGSFRSCGGFAAFCARALRANPKPKKAISASFVEWADAFRSITARDALLVRCAGQPEEAVQYQLVFRFIVKGERQLLVGLVLVIDVVVSHVEIDHFIFLIGPHHRVIAAVPDFVRFRARPQ